MSILSNFRKGAVWGTPSDDENPVFDVKFIRFSVEVDSDFKDQDFQEY